GVLQAAGYNAAVPYPAMVEGYFAGRVLTMTTGPAAGQSTYIIRWYNNAPGAGAGDWRMWIRPFANGAIPRIGDRYVINGRPFNGMGFGYDNTSQKNDPGRLGSNALVLNKSQTTQGASSQPSPTDPPFALAPNPTHPSYLGYLKDRPNSAGDGSVNPDGVD